MGVGVGWRGARPPQPKPGGRSDTWEAASFIWALLAALTQILPSGTLSWQRLIESRVYHFYDFIRQDRGTVGFLSTGLLDGAVALLGSTCSSPSRRGIVPTRRHDHSQTDKTGPILGLFFFLFVLDTRGSLK